MTGLWNVLNELKQQKWVNLSHSLTSDSPYWGGMPDGVVALNEEVVGFDSEFNLRICTQKFPGQFGTHIDFPGHFIEGARLAKDFDFGDFILPIVVIDLSAKAAENADYEITLQDIADFEAEYGRIPEGCLLAMRTDWSKRWPDMDALSNADADGVEHFPGWTMETINFLVDERNVAALGHETLDTDAPITSTEVGDLQCERLLLAKDRFQIEMLTNLDQLPATGAFVFIGFPKIADANGLPVSITAICPR